MAKVIAKNFEGFKGNNRGASELTREPGFSKNSKNIEVLDNMSITKRTGMKLMSSFDEGVSRGLMNYSYLDSTTGETKNELLYLHYESSDWYLYRVLPARMMVKSTRPTPIISLTLDTVNSEWEVDLKSAGVSETGYPKKYGTGLEVGADTIEDVYFDIVATAGWDTGGASIDEYGRLSIIGTVVEEDMYAGGLIIDEDVPVKQGAMANGTQSNVSTITVDSGHDIVAGDTISTSDGFVRQVASVTATTITVHGETLSIIDNQLIYSGALRFYGLSRVGGLTTPAGVLPAYSVYDKDYAIPSYVNQNNILYFCVNGDYIFKYDGNACYRAGLPTATQAFKDEMAFYPDFASSSTVETGYHLGAVYDTPAGALTGNYYYGYTYINQDAKGNRSESKLFELSNGSQFVFLSENASLSIPSVQVSLIGGTTANSTQNTVTTINMSTLSTGLMVGDTVVIRDNTGGVKTWVDRTISSFDASANTITINSAISVTPYDPVYVTRRDEAIYNLNSAVIDGTQNAVVNINVVAGHSLQKGDTAYLYDYKKEQYVESLITAIAPTLITIADSVSVSDLAVISNNLRIGIYRTRDGGLDKYLIAEIPHNGVFPQNFYTDNMLDDFLGAKYIAPIRDPYPNSKASFISAHQGIQVFAGAIDNPNTLFFSEPNDIESYPIATNSVDVPFTQKGVMTGTVSDRELITLFKERGRAIIRGELYTGNFNVEIVEDGIGCASHASVVKTPIGDLFVSYTGFQRLVRGELDPQFSKFLSDDFVGVDYQQITGVSIPGSKESTLVPKRATAVNDYRKERVIFFIPAEEGVVGVDRSLSAYSKFYCYDYKQGAWIDYVMGEDTITGYGGMVIYNDELVMCGHNQLFIENQRGDSYDYADNTEVISFKLQDSWDFAGEPSLLKKFLRVKTWSLQPEYHIPNSLTLKTYLDFNDTTAHTVATMDFTSSSTRERLIKLRGAQKSRSIMIEFNNDTIHESPLITGYELEIAPIYDKEIKE